MRARWEETAALASDGCEASHVRKKRALSEMLPFGHEIPVKHLSDTFRNIVFAGR